MLPSNIKEPGQYPLPELASITLTKATDQLTTFEHLLVAQVLEAFKRIRRNSKGI
jgi:hypothetical protein